MTRARDCRPLGETAAARWPYSRATAESTGRGVESAFDQTKAAEAVSADLLAGHPGTGKIVATFCG
jgi:hypothetical protein